MKKKRTLFHVYLIIRRNPKGSGTFVCTGLKNSEKIFSTSVPFIKSGEKEFPVDGPNKFPCYHNTN